MKITDTLKQIMEKVEPYYAEGQKEIDITAVLKYIIRSGVFVECGEFFLKKFEVQLKYGKGQDGYGMCYFPNKPLSLYTEEELKHLLEILNNIENND